jgi:branched-subunit amino acid aminotransferase/4-amino-4-deoxychorismate lyase
MQIMALNQNLASLRNEAKKLNLKINEKETEINEAKGFILGNN